MLCDHNEVWAVACGQCVGFNFEFYDDQIRGVHQSHEINNLLLLPLQPPLDPIKLPP